VVLLGINLLKSTRFFDAKNRTFILWRVFTLNKTYRTVQKWTLHRNIFENVNTSNAIQSRDQLECNVRYGDSGTNQNRRRLGVCRLWLQPVNTQTSCQSLLRHSKQSEEIRKNTTASEYARLFHRGIFVTILGLHVPFVTSRDAWFARGRTIMAAFVCGVWRFRWNSAQAPWKTWHL